MKNIKKHRMETRSRCTKSACISAAASRASKAVANLASNPHRIIKKRRKRTSFECIICLNSYTSNIPFSTGKCTHQTCRQCIRKYFKSVIQDTRYSSSFEFVQCPSSNCSQHFVTGNVLSTFYGNAEQDRWWRNAIKKAYIKNKVLYYYLSFLNNNTDVNNILD